MRVYKNFKSLVKNTNNLTLQKILNGRANFKSKSGFSVWSSFKYELTEDQLEEISQLLGGHQKTKEGVRRTLRHGKPQHWALDRIVFCPHRKQFTYIAGQDMPTELNQIRKYLSK